MWTAGVALLVWAADEPAGSGTATDQLAVIVGGIVTTSIVTVGSIVIAVYNARKNRTEPSPPAPSSATPTADAIAMREDIAVLRYRADDSDERDEIQDRRLDQIERHLDIENPRWRGGPRS